MAKKDLGLGLGAKLQGEAGPRASRFAGAFVESQGLCTPGRPTNFIYEISCLTFSRSLQHLRYLRMGTWEFRENTYRVGPCNCLET